jgi:hypothetical protein
MKLEGISVGRFEKGLDDVYFSQGLSNKLHLGLVMGYG